MATDTTAERSSSAASDVKEKGSELVHSAQEQVAAKAGEMSEDLAFKLRDQVALRSTEAGDQVQAIARALRSTREQIRAEGSASTAHALDGVARRAEDLGDYLKSTDPDQMLAQVEDFARRRPWIAGGIAACAGFVAARFLRASSERRYGTRRTDRPSTSLDLDQGVAR
jgi:ElaB/YqjD/DUF883 family membrane-anchored ribosome-binding protein